MENNRICSCCGAAYKYCNQCGSENDHPWKKMFDTEFCKNLFYRVSDYYAKNATIEDIKKALKGHDISNMTFKNGIQPVVDEATRVVSQPVVVPRVETTQKVKDYKPKNNSTTYKKNN